MKRGLPKTKQYLLKNYFNDDFHIYLNPGLPANVTLTTLELEAFAAEYEEFVANNIDRVTTVTEITGARVPQEFIEHQRKTVWAQVPPGKFQPVWQPATGFKGLQKMVDTYLDIALPGEAIESEAQLSSATRLHTSRHGTRFHAIGCARPDNLRQVPVETASTLSWLSPMLHGETIVWDGTKLNRYPKKMKDQARSRYSHVYLKAGVDQDKIIEDDAQEVCKLAVWSYEQFETRFNGMNGMSGFDDFEDEAMLYINNDGMEGVINAESTPAVYDKRGVEMRKLEQRNPAEMGNLPVFGFEVKTEVDEDGTIKEVPVVQNRSGSLRACDTCFVASNCPAFKPQNTCAFNLPIEVKTKEQLKSLINAIIEMQGQRVAFMRFAEELNGGYADPNVSQEIDRLLKLMKTVKELDDSREFIRMTVERQGSAGVLSSIFGERAQQLTELPDGGLNEIQTTRIIKDSLEDK
jgi:hypothetical protein